MYEGLRGDSDLWYKGLVTSVSPLVLLVYGNVTKLLPNGVALGVVDKEDESPLFEVPYNGDSGIDFFLVSFLLTVLYLPSISLLFPVNLIF